MDKNRIFVIILIVMICIEEKTCMNTGGRGRRGGRRGGSRGKAVQVDEEPPETALIQQFQHYLEFFQNLTNEVQNLRTCLQLLQQNRQDYRQLNTNLRDNIQDIENLEKFTNDPQQWGDERRNIYDLCTFSSFDFVKFEREFEPQHYDYYMTNYQNKLNQEEEKRQEVLTQLYHQIQTISQINPLMAQQLREQLEVIQRQGETIHHHEAGPSHHVQAGAGPSHQFQAGDAPMHQFQDPEYRQNLMYRLFGTPSNSNHNGGSEAKSNDSD